MGYADTKLQHAGFAGLLDDGVLPSIELEEIGVSTGTAIQTVIAGSAVQVVVSPHASDAIIQHAAKKHIAFDSAGDLYPERQQLFKRHAAAVGETDLR